MSSEKNYAGQAQLFAEEKILLVFSLARNFIQFQFFALSPSLFSSLSAPTSFPTPRCGHLPCRAALNFSFGLHRELFMECDILRDDKGYLPLPPTP